MTKSVCLYRKINEFIIQIFNEQKALFAAVLSRVYYGRYWRFQAYFENIWWNLSFLVDKGLCQPSSTLSKQHLFLWWRQTRSELSVVRGDSGRNQYYRLVSFTRNCRLFQSAHPAATRQTSIVLPTVGSLGQWQPFSNTHHLHYRVEQYHDPNKKSRFYDAIYRDR